MQVYCNGSARIKHKTTESIYEVKSDELDWDAVGADERQMGSEIHYEAAVELNWTPFAGPRVVGFKV